MEYYQAQYYNEALMHYGVKGMKWGVRRKRIANAAKTAKNYGKEYGKAWVNVGVHPVRTIAAHGGLNRNARMKTVLRRSLGIHSRKELEAINKDVRNQGRNMKRIKSQPKTKTKLAKPQPIRRAYETARLGGNSIIHPIRTLTAVAESNRNKRMKTILRRQLALGTNEIRALNDDVKKQNIAMKKQRNAKKLSRKERRKATRALRVNTVLHPVKAQKAMIETQKNASLKTTARQHYRGYNTQEAKAITKHIRKQVVEEANAAAKAARKPRKRKRR